jgi:uncharacterized protein (TIGR02996 family)
MHDDSPYLRAICRDPFDDGPRLVWADCLDERGDPRGEFIRVQCELPRIESRIAVARRAVAEGRRGLRPPEKLLRRAEELRRRERELLGDLCPLLLTGLPDTPAVMIGGDYHYDRPFYGDHSLYRVEFDRGLVGSVTLATVQFLGGPCGRCEEERRHARRHARRYAREGQHAAAASRLAAATRCPACRGTGRVEGLAAALFRAAPVTEVRLSDREPLRISDGWVLSRGSGGPEMTRHVIPPEVFDLIPTVRGGLGGLDERPEAGWIRTSNVVTDAPEELLFLAPNRAHAALSVACVAYGRSSFHPPAAESKR